MGSFDGIEIEIPFEHLTQRETRVFRGSGDVPPIASATEIVVFSAADRTRSKRLLFEHAVAKDGDVAVPPADAVVCMSVIESILRPWCCVHCSA